MGKMKLPKSLRAIFGKKKKNKKNNNTANGRIVNGTNSKPPTSTSTPYSPLPSPKKKSKTAVTNKQSGSEPSSSLSQAVDDTSFKEIINNRNNNNSNATSKLSLVVTTTTDTTINNTNNNTSTTNSNNNNNEAESPITVASTLTANSSSLEDDDEDASTPHAEEVVLYSRGGGGCCSTPNSDIVLIGGDVMEEQPQLSQPREPTPLKNDNDNSTVEKKKEGGINNVNDNEPPSDADGIGDDTPSESSSVQQQQQQQLSTLNFSFTNDADSPCCSIISGDNNSNEDINLVHIVNVSNEKKSDSTTAGTTAAAVLSLDLDDTTIVVVTPTKSSSTSSENDDEEGQKANNEEDHQSKKQEERTEQQTISPSAKMVQDAAFENRSGRMDVIRAALEKAREAAAEEEDGYSGGGDKDMDEEEDNEEEEEEEEEEDTSTAIEVDEEIPSRPELSSFDVPVMPSYDRTTIAVVDEVPTSSSSATAIIVPPNNNNNENAADSALAWTALAGIMSAPAPQQGQRKPRSTANLWKDDISVESDIDNISIASSSTMHSMASMALSSSSLLSIAAPLEDDCCSQVTMDNMDAMSRSSKDDPQAGVVPKSTIIKQQTTKRVQFSIHGEQAKRRAIARQKKILSKASLRLGAISETSLENIEEADNQVDKFDRNKYVPVVVKGRRRDGNNEEEEEEDTTDDGESVMGLTSIGTSQRSVVSHQVIEGGKGGICSIAFYEVSGSSSSGGGGGGGTKLLDNNRSRLEEDSKKDVAEKVLNEGEVMPAGGKQVAATTEEVINPSNKVHQGNEQQAVVTTASSNDESTADEENIHFFILLLCPTSRIFELVEISDATRNYTIQDIINTIPKQCTDDRLLSKKYIGFVRPSDRMDFTTQSNNAMAFVKKSPQEPQLEEDDVLVAILEGYSGYQMVKISKPILKNGKFREMIGRRSKKGVPPPMLIGSKRSGGGSDIVGVDNKLVRSNKSSQSSQGRRRRYNRTRMGGNSSSRSGGGIKDDNNLINSEIISSGSSSNSRESSTKDSKGSSTHDSRYSNLTQKLEDLSKKLNDVDDEILARDDDEEEGEEEFFPPDSLKTPSKERVVVSTNVLIDMDNDDDEGTIAASILGEVSASAVSSAYKMTPKMVAYELAANIEDIFADHDVEIVAVDADDYADLDSDDDIGTSSSKDDDTFVSAKSMLNASDVRSVRSLVKEFNSGVGGSSSMSTPVLEITTKKKRQRKSKPSKFSNYEEDDMMLQIEAMARQADVAFESRKKNVALGGGTSAMELTEIDVADDAAIEEDYISKNQEEVNDEYVMEVVASSVDNEMPVTPNNVLGAMKAITKKGNTSLQRDALSRNFLNASTSMVSTMVAASQGRVNEVHVLQYLGVTIVCIAANFMQHTRQAAGMSSPGGGAGMLSPGGGGVGFGGNSFGAKEIMQSAMFLAFMVNGQRYLAKVTKKSK